MSTCIAASMLILLAPGAEAPFRDPPKIEREVEKEPRYIGRPKYLYLLFGKDSPVSMLCVLDGDVLYLDSNANRDLTEERERAVSETDRFLVTQTVRANDREYRLTIRDAGLASENTPRRIWVEVNVGVDYKMYSTVDLDKACDTPQTAPLRHFGGPLQFLLWNEGNFTLMQGDKHQELSITISTVYRNWEAWSHVSSEEGFSNEIHPRAEIAFPNRSSNRPPIVVTVPLDQRC